MEKELWDELKVILDTMDIPALRRNDILWMSRNLQFKNKEHADFDQAMLLIRLLIKQRFYGSAKD